jgi:hypothetical protein
MTDLDLVARLAKEAASRTGREINVHRDWAEAFAALVADECGRIIEAQDVDPAFKGRMAWAVRARFVHSPPAASESVRRTESG